MSSRNSSSDDVTSRRQALYALGGVMLGTAAVGVGTSTVGAAPGRPTPITGYTEITESGRYELVDDIHITADRTLPSLLPIFADDVRLNGNGYSITTDTSVEFGGLYAANISSLRITDLHIPNLRAPGFTIQGGEDITMMKCSSVGGGSGVALQGNPIEKLRIRQCEFSESRWGISIITDQINSKIVNNEIRDNSELGIRLSASDGSHISGNSIVNNGDWGVAVTSQPGRPSENNRIVGNYFCGNGGAIYVDDDSENKNRIQGNRSC